MVANIFIDIFSNFWRIALHIIHPFISNNLDNSPFFLRQAGPSYTNHTKY